jgi:hypothetical protein
MRRALILVAILAAIAAALLVNAMLVDAKTRPAVARTGGALMETGVVTANVRIEGEGPPSCSFTGSAPRSIGGMRSRRNWRATTR